MSTATIVWFRRDLRLSDNPALRAAAATGDPVVPLFIWEAADGPWAPGAASRWWLWHSLKALDTELRARGSRLLVLRGPVISTLARVAAACNAGRLHFAHTGDPGEPTAAEIRRAVAAAGAELTVSAWPPNLLFGPPFPAAKGGRPYQAFTPFWRACRAADPPTPPLPVPSSLPAPATWPAGIDLCARAHEAVRPWSHGFTAVWRPGEAGGRERLDAFVQAGVGTYAQTRDRVDVPGTSRLSAHLHFGEVSAATVWHAIEDAVRGAPGSCSSDSAEAFLRQLAWREFAYHVLMEHPHAPEAPLRPDYAAFPWHDDPEALEIWQRACTGYPLVDAGLRELWQTGWMHNRARLVCASFLCKHLLVRWQHGARWFWDTLVDADLADNSLGWQWVAGSGTDAAPYFRIFNPVLQGRRYDPGGAYVRKWLPELARLPDAFIHAPWEAPANELRRAGVRMVSAQEAASITPDALGPRPLPHGLYPEPVIDHRVGRRRALEAFNHLRRGY